MCFSNIEIALLNNDGDESGNIVFHWLDHKGADFHHVYLLNLKSKSVMLQQNSGVFSLLRENFKHNFLQVTQQSTSRNMCQIFAVEFNSSEPDL